MTGFPQRQLALTRETTAQVARWEKLHHNDWEWVAASFQLLGLVHTDNMRMPFQAAWGSLPCSVVLCSLSTSAPHCASPTSLASISPPSPDRSPTATTTTVMLSRPPAVL